MSPYREDLRLRYQDVFQRSRKHQRIGNMREGDDCFYHDVNRVKPCTVQCWSVLKRLLTVLGHVQAIVINHK